MASEEKAPLRKSELTLKQPRPNLHPADEFNSKLILLPLMALEEHYQAILTTVCSAMLCTLMGYAEVWVIDPTILKCIFVVFGFSMGFRNVRANTRYAIAMQKAALWFAGFWGVYAPLQREVQLKVGPDLLEAMQVAAAYIHLIADSRDNSWYGILGIEPEQKGQTACGWEGVDMAGLNGRLRLVDALNRIGDELLRIGDMSIERTFKLHQKLVLENYDHLLALALPSVTTRFKIFVDICLGFFTVFMPWGTMARSVEFDALGQQWHISPGVVLVMNTTAVIWVVYALDSIITQNEDPVSGDPDDVNLILLTDALVYEVQDYERRTNERSQP